MGNPDREQASNLQAEYEYWVQKAQEAQENGDQVAYEQALAKIEEIQSQARG